MSCPASPRPQKEKTPTFAGDPRLVARLREYMADSPFRHLSPSRINFLLVANDMMSTYSDYRRKKIQPFKVSIETAWKVIAEVDRKSKEKSVSQGGWTIDRRPAGEESASDPLFIEDFSGSDSNLETVKEDDEETEGGRTPTNLTTYEDTNAVNSMMQGLYSQSARKLVTQSAPASPAAKREAATDAPRTPDSGLGTGNSASKAAKSSSAKKKVK